MMYFLHRLSDQVGGFNVFFYVTFRAVAAAITAFVVSLLFGNFVIRILTALKLGQPIRQASEVHRLAAFCQGEQDNPPQQQPPGDGGVLLYPHLYSAPDSLLTPPAAFCPP